MSALVGSKVVSAVVGGAAKGATPILVKNFVEKVVSPYFSGKKSKTKIVAGTRKYTRNIEFRTRLIPSIAIKGGTFVLDEIYEPLQLVRIGDGEKVDINGYPSKLFNENRCVAIIDSAGMGKSTLTKYVIRRCLSDLKKIPLLVELRRLKAGQTILNLICEEILGNNRTEALIDELSSALMEGNFLFLLDGYDEVGPDLRANVSSEISRISSDFQYCNFWLTSRPDSALIGFPEFSVFEISNLRFDQACSLLERYDQGRGLASVLIDKLDTIPQVKDFLGNPLLVTLLYKAFDYKATIPIKRNIFFRQVFDALYQDHDLSKEGAFERRKKSALDLDDFHKFLRALGFITSKVGKVQYSQEEFIEHLKSAIHRANLAIDHSKIRMDLLSAVPVFVRDGDEVRWSHKAFQDYFSAQFIYYDAGNFRREIISRIFFSNSIGRYENIIRMLGELDLGLLRDICIFPFLKGIGIFEKIENGNYYSSKKYICQVSDVYVIKEFRLGKGEGGSGRFVDFALTELHGSFPDLEKRMMSSVTYSAKDAVAVIVFNNGDVLRNRVMGEIDVASFPIGRREGLALAEIKSIMPGKVVLLNDLVGVLQNQESLRVVLDLMANVANITIPSDDSLELLRADVDRRASAKDADSLLEGL